MMKPKCAECGKEEESPLHIRYGADVNNPRKHEFVPREKKKRSDFVISKKGVRDFVKTNGKYVTQVDKMFYAVLDHRVKTMILNAISNNCSRKKLTAGELGGINGKE